MKDSNGFTLLELMITIAVLAILVALATPSFRATIQRSQVSEQMRNFSAFLQESRAKAVTRRVPYQATLGTPVKGGNLNETSNSSGTFSPDDKVSFAPSTPTLTFSLMGQTNVEACYVMTHTDNPTIGQTLHIDRNGSITINKNAITCP